MFRLAFIALPDDVSISFQKKERLYFFFQIHRWYLESVEAYDVKITNSYIISVNKYDKLYFVILSLHVQSIFYLLKCISVFSGQS